MGHKSRAEQRQARKRRNHEVDHQVNHKGRSPKVYRRSKVDIDKYIEELNRGWKDGIDT
jgi:hypothetical protein